MINYKRDKSKVPCSRNKTPNGEIKDRDKKKMKAVITLIKLIRERFRGSDEKSRNYFFQYIVPYLVTVLCEVYENLNDKGRGRLDMGYKNKKEKVSTGTLFKENVRITTEYVKSGLLIIDALLGGGIPKGSISLISGPSGCGKTTLLLAVCKGFCIQGLKVLYLDFEASLNESLLNGIGVSTYVYDRKLSPDGKLYIQRPETFEECENYIEGILEEDFGLVVIDSATAMLCGKASEKSVEENDNGLKARAMSNFLGKYRAKLVKKGIAVLISNQMRTHLNFKGNTGLQEAGGNALKHYADCRIKLSPNARLKIERDEELVCGKQKVEYGAVLDIWCEKNRYTRPDIKLKLHILYGRGVSNDYAYIDCLIAKKKIKKSGSWYEVDLNDQSTKLHGEENLMEWIRENRDAVKAFIHNNGGFKMIEDNIIPQQHKLMENIKGDYLSGAFNDGEMKEGEDV